MALRGRPSREKRRSSREGAQKPARNLSFHWPFLAASPGGTALLKGGRAKVRAQSFLPLALRGRQSRNKRRSSKEGAQKSARSLFFPWPFLATSPGGTALLKGGRAKVRAQPLLSIGPFWPPAPGERRSSKEGAQKSARSLFFPLALSGHQPRGNGAPQRRARKSPRAASSFHWPFLAASPGGTALLKGGRAKVRAQPLLLALSGRQSRGNGAPQRRARKSPRAASSFHWPFLATSPGGTALLKGGRAKVRAQSFLPLAFLATSPGGTALLKGGRAKVRAQPLLSIGPFWPPAPGERRSSKEGAQKSARSLFFPLALSGRQSRGNGAPQRRARKSPRAASSFHWPFLAASPRGTALLKGGRAKVRAQSFLPLALSGRQSRGNGAPQRRARKSPRAIFPSIGPSRPPVPGEAALLKGGRAKVRAQPLLSIGPFWPPVPGERRSSKGGAQKSARDLSFHWPFLATSPGGTALLKGGRAKVRSRPLLSIGPSWPPVPGERRSSKEGAQKSARSLFLPWALPGHQSPQTGAPQRRARKSPRAASSFHWPFFLPLALSGRQSRGNGAPQRRARKSPRAASSSIGPSWPPVPGERRSSKEGAQKSARNLSFHWPFLAASPGGTALLKGGRAKVRAQPLLSIGPSWPPVPGERRSSKEGAQKSARSLFLPLALPRRQSRGKRLLKGGRAKVHAQPLLSIGPSWPPVLGNDAPQRGRAKVRAQPLPFHWPFLATSPGGTALLKGGRAKVRARPFLPLALPGRQSRGKRRSSKEGAQKSARSLFLPLALPGHQSRGNGAPQRRARKSPRAASSFHWPFLATSPRGTALLKGGRAKVRAQPLPSIGPFWPPAPGERRSSKEGAQKSARSLFFPLALSGRQSRGNGAPQRRARKSPRAASSFHWPFLAASPRGTALLKGGRAKVRAQSFLPLALSGRQSRGNGAPQRRARKSPRAIFPSIGPSRPPVPGEAALLKGGRAKVRAQSFLPLALPGRQSRKKRRSSKEGAQKSARSLFFPLALSGRQSRGNGAPQRGARKSPRETFPSIGSSWPPVPGEAALLKGGRAKVRARPVSFHWPFLATNPGGTALLKGGRAKVRAQPLLSIGPFWPPVPGERRSSKEVRAQPLLSTGPFWPPAPGERRSLKEGAQKSARNLSFHWLFLAASPGGTALLKGGRAKVRAQPFLSIGPFWPPAPGERRSSKEGAQKSARSLSFHWPFLAASPGGTALLKGGRAKVRAQPFLSTGPFWPPAPGERRSLKEGAQKSARNLSFHWLFLAASPGGTALLKGGRAKVRAQSFLPLALRGRQSRGKRRSSKERAQKSARSLFFPLALSGHQSRGNGAPQRGARKSPRATFPSIGPSWPPVPGEQRSSKEGAQKSARGLFFPLALLPSIGPSWPPVPGERRSSKEGAQKSARSLFCPLALPAPGNGAPQRRARKSPRAASSFHWPFLATSPGGTALLKGGRAKVRAQPLPSIGPSWPPVPGERRSSKEGAQKSARSLSFPLALSGHQSRGNGAPQRRARKSPRAASSFHGPFLVTSPGGTALLKGGRAKVRAQPLLSIGPSCTGERRSSKEGAQKSARALFPSIGPSWPPIRGNGTPQRRARKSPRAASSFHWPFLATCPGGTALLKGGRAKVRAQPLLSTGPFWPPAHGGTALLKGGRAKSPRAASSFHWPFLATSPRGNGAPQRRARKSPRAASSFHWPFLAASPGGTALLKGGRAKVRAQPLPSIGPFWPPAPGERRSSKEGAQKPARALFPSVGPSWPPIPGERRSSKEGAQKSARALFFPLPLADHQSWGKRLLKEGRAKVRAQLLLSIGPFWPPVPGEWRSSKEGAQKSARDLSFHWSLPATSPGGKALLKGGRAKVRAQPLPSMRPFWPPVAGEAALLKGGRALPGKRVAGQRTPYTTGA